MPDVRATCTETRYIGTDENGKSRLYKAGDTYTVDAERCGKYREYFHPVTDSDRVEAEAAWNRRLEEVQAQSEVRQFLANVDPSIVKAAVIAIQGQIEQTVQARLDAAMKPAKGAAA